MFLFLLVFCYPAASPLASPIPSTLGVVCTSLSFPLMSLLSPGPRAVSLPRSIFPHSFLGFSFTFSLPFREASPFYLVLFPHLRFSIPTLSVYPLSLSHPHSPPPLLLALHLSCLLQPHPLPLVSLSLHQLSLASLAFVSLICSLLLQFSSLEFSSSFYSPLRSHFPSSLPSCTGDCRAEGQALRQLGTIVVTAIPCRQ